MASMSGQAELHSYVVDTDSGFAPNTTEEVCTLATCKQVIRDEAEEGDWVLGTYPREHGEEQITYLMRVDEKITYDEYYNSGRFDYKKPENDRMGDNIYYRDKEGDLVQVQNPPSHDNDECRERDLKSNWVLISNHFWYFGGSGPELPPDLCESVIKGYKSSSRSGRKKPSKHLDSLLSWINEQYDRGVHGQPRDEVDSSCGCLSDSSSDDGIC